MQRDTALWLARTITPPSSSASTQLLLLLSATTSAAALTITIVTTTELGHDVFVDPGSQSQGGAKAKGHRQSGLQVGEKGRKSLRMCVVGISVIKARRQSEEGAWWVRGAVCLWNEIPHMYSYSCLPRWLPRTRTPVLPFGRWLSLQGPASAQQWHKRHTTHMEMRPPGWCLFVWLVGGVIA